MSPPINPMNVSFLQELMTTVAEQGRAMLPKSLLWGDDENIEDLARHLVSSRGESAGVAIARRILNRYKTLTDDEKRTFLTFLGTELQPDAGIVADAAKSYLGAPDAQSWPAAEQGNAKAKLALDVFVASARHWIGSYFFEMGGTDAIVFTAGIGENRAELREAICANLDGLGIELDSALNASTRATEAVISKAGSRVKIMVIPTNEELVVARETKRLLENSRN